MKKSSHFFIIILLLYYSSVFALTLAEMTVEEVPEGEGISYIVRNTEESILVVHSNIPEMTFETNMGIIRVDRPDPGEFRLHLYPGSNIVTFKAEGYMPVKQHIYIPKKDYKEFRVRAGVIAEEQQVVVRVIPADASVIIDDQPMDISSSIVLLKGEHRIAISCLGYENVVDSFSVSKENILFEYSLQKPQLCVIEVKTEPAGTTVEIEGVKLAGVTPLEGFYNSGTYPITISLDKHLTITDTVTIKQGESDNIFSYNLEPNSGLLTIKTNPGARVYLNDELILQYTSLKLSPQTVKLHVEKPRCTARDSSLIIRRGSNETVELFLDEATGTIAVLTSPSDAQVELRGSGGEYFFSTGTKIFSGIPVGTYDLSVNKRGYQTERRKVTLKADETKQESVTLSDYKTARNTPKKNKPIDFSHNLGTIGLGYRNEYERNYYNARLTFYGSFYNMEAHYRNSRKDYEELNLLYELAAKPNFNITRNFSIFGELGYGIGLNLNFYHYDNKTAEVFYWNAGLVASAGFRCRIANESIIASLRYRQADNQWLKDITGYYKEYMPRYYRERIDIFVGSKNLFTETVGLGFQMTNWGNTRYEYWDHIWQGWHDAWEYSIALTFQ